VVPFLTSFQLTSSLLISSKIMMVLHMVPDLHRYHHHWWLHRNLLSACSELFVAWFFASLGKRCLLFAAAFFDLSKCVGSLSCDDLGKINWRTTPHKLHKCGFSCNTNPCVNIPFITCPFFI